MTTDRGDGNDGERNLDPSELLIGFDFSPDAWKQAPPIQRGLCVISQRVLTDISRLRLCYHFALSYPEPAGEIAGLVRAAQIHQALFFARLLACVLFEAGLVLEDVFGPKPRPRYASAATTLREQMSSSERDSLAWCLNDLAARRPFLARLRGEVTYHYKLDKAVENAANISGSPTSLYFSEAHGNCFHPVADVAPHRIITEGFGLSYPKELRKAAFAFGSWVHDASDQCANVLGFIVHHFATTYLGMPTSPGPDDVEYASLSWAPRCAEVSLPYFVRWTDDDEAQRLADLAALDGRNGR